MRIWKVIDPVKIEIVRALVQEIKAGSKSNVELWENLAPFEFTQYYRGSTFNKCNSVAGVVPADENVELPKGWLKTKDRGVVPNGRTKEGKELQREIDTNTVQIPYFRIYYAAGLKDRDAGRFTIPGVYEAADGTEVYVSLDSKHDLSKDKNFEEVTQSYVEEKINGVQKG